MTSRDAPESVAPVRQASASRSSLITGSTTVIIAILNYAFANLMAWLLPVSGYGVVGMAQSWLLIAVALLNSGFIWELVRVIAYGTSQAEVYRTAKTAGIGVFVIAVVLSFVLLGVTRFTSSGFGVDEGQVIILLVVEIFLLAIAAIYSGVLQGTLRFGTLGLSQVTEAIVKVLAGIVLVLLGFGAEGALGAIVLGTITYLAVLAWNARQFQFWRERSWGGWQTYRNSLALLVGLSALTVASNIDIIGLKLFSPVSQGNTLAGYYQAAVVLARIPLILAGAYAAALFPFIARLNGDEVLGYIQRAVKYYFMLIVPISLILSAIPEAMISFIFPATYQVSQQALRISALGTAVLALVTVLLSAMQARGIARFPAIWISFAAVVEIVALRLLVPKLAITGAAIALLIGSLVALTGLAVLLMRHYKWHPSVKDVVKYIFAIASFVGILVLLPNHNRVWTVATVTIALTAYVALLSLAGLLQGTDVTVLTDGLSNNSRLAALRVHCVRAVERLNRLS